jgi:hypothetical protein
MGIINGFAFSVVLAVNGSPFFGNHAGGEPEPETKEVRGNRMQIERTVRLAAVQENGDASNSDVR